MQCNGPNVADIHSQLLDGDAAGSADSTGTLPDHDFLPRVPSSLADAGLGHGQIEALVLKHLLDQHAATGRQIAEQLALPFRFVEEPLHRLKAELLVLFKASAPLGDYLYELTDLGTERGRRHLQRCAYVGPTPVPLDAYVASVEAQSVRKQKPKLRDVRRALSDLVVSEDLLGRIGEAVNLGFGFFLHGAPGNGKTSIAERITEAYGESVWIPRAIDAFGETIQLYDPHNHHAWPAHDGPSVGDSVSVDQRWVCIQRPTIVAGGELTLGNLEIARDPATGVSEAPLQMKSNCGTLVIDDFGRQRVSPAEMLNRWIVPLERRHDYLRSPSGRKLCVPFDQLVIFASNLDPATLVDEAFLRRVPYKIEVRDPTEGQYRQLFRQLAVTMGIACRDEAIDYVVAKTARRCRRFCHPQALLQQVGNYCDFREIPAVATPTTIDAAMQNYFAVV